MAEGSDKVDDRRPFLRHYGLGWDRNDKSLARRIMLGRPSAGHPRVLCNFWSAGGIYMLLRDSAPVYVGIGGRIGSRLVKHAHESHLAESWNRFSWFSTEELDQLSSASGMVIAEARPPVGGGDKGGRETRPIRVWWTWSDIEALYYLTVPSVKSLQSPPKFGTKPRPTLWSQDDSEGASSQWHYRLRGSRANGLSVEPEMQRA